MSEVAQRRQDRIGLVDWYSESLGSAGPRLLLLHGTGASTHSWRDLLSDLAQDFKVLAVDLPGHARSRTARGFRPTLPNVATALSSLLTHLKWQPDIVAGHSAGAAIAIELALRHPAPPKALVSFNGALLPFQGPAARIFPAMARALYLNPVARGFFAWQADKPETVAKLLSDTGSTLTDEGVASYSRLFRNREHLRGALALMAYWDLLALKRRLPKLQVPLLLVTGLRDRAVPPSTAESVAKLVGAPKVERLDGLGHLAHEEDPGQAAALIRQAAVDAGLPLGRSVQTS
ncbi:MAG: alpha/beta fold hydrolase BchO [Pseudomonadota bacterium]